MRLFYPDGWKDYNLLDSGNGYKLERFGRFVLARPEPQAVWMPFLTDQEWKTQAHARFVPEGSSSGRWDKSPGMPDQWQVSWKHDRHTLRFRLGLTVFKHIGLFPEQAANWKFILESCNRRQQASVLNLFAYTGGASLAARAAGADVIHCDSIRQVVNWARENMELSNLSNIRWLVEDALKFVQKEQRRGRKYDGIIMDPPAWGHGPNGETWKLEDMINQLVTAVAGVLKPDGFLIFNSYSLGFSPLILHNLVLQHLGEQAAQACEIGELYFQDQGKRKLPMGIVCRCDLMQR